MPTPSTGVAPRKFAVEAGASPAGAFLRAGSLASAGIVGVLMLLAALRPHSEDDLTDYLYLVQDARWLAFLIVVFVIFARAPLPAFDGLWRLASARRNGFVVGGVLAVGALAWLGAHVVLSNYALSRDEDMAEFDARILQSGRLVAPIAEAWRDYFADLGTIFMLTIPGHAAWVSAYLPVNAAFRALFGLLGDRALTGPFFAMASLLAVFAAARKLWPERRDAAFVAFVVLALSPQFLATAMTPFAMTAHLALNALWLLLFMRGDTRGHAGAVCVGFLATGLHQLVFHPLFAAPFIVQLWFQGRRGAAVYYVAAYGLIGLFWAQYFGLALSLEGLSPQAAEGAGVRLFIGRALEVLQSVDFVGAWAMQKNLLRFVGWQHVLLLPLAFYGLSALRRAGPIVLSLAAGLLLNGLVMFLLMPVQGYGWGYRYWHGLMINTALLAAWGWIVVHERFGEDGMRRLRAVFTAASMVGFFALVPLRLWQARELTRPYALAYAAIARAPADVVLVDRTGHRFTGDLVRNEPFLRNKPLILDMNALTPVKLRDLCARYRIGVFGPREADALGIPEFFVGENAVRRLANARLELAGLECGFQVEPIGAR